MITLLQSDIKSALKSAFGILDGPLSVTDWCKGHSHSGDVVTINDGFSAELGVNEGRDSSNTVTIGEPISPSQSAAGGSSCIKGIFLLLFCHYDFLIFSVLKVGPLTQFVTPLMELEWMTLAGGDRTRNSLVLSQSSNWAPG